jgi:hypothetical protein
MPTDYLKSAFETMTTLPLEKQEEVYDFVNFLKMTTVHTPMHRKKKGSLLKIIEQEFCELTVVHISFLIALDSMHSRARSTALCNVLSSTSFPGNSVI